jgi:hypothetical protein
MNPDPIIETNNNISENLINFNKFLDFLIWCLGLRIAIFKAERNSTWIGIKAYHNTNKSIKISKKLGMKNMQSYLQTKRSNNFT